MARTSGSDALKNQNKLEIMNGHFLDDESDRLYQPKGLER